MKPYGYMKENKIITDDHDHPVATVEFDIALAEAAKDTKGGIGLLVSLRMRSARRELGFEGVPL